MVDNETAPHPTLQTPEQWLANVRQCEREGELFRAYDLARQALTVFPDDQRLKHRAVLSLASSGATQQAKALFAAFGLEHHPDTRLTTALGLDIAALGPRLLKDEALAATGDVRRHLLIAAADAYADLYRQAVAVSNPEAYYPGINAATLYLLAGQSEPATIFAREVMSHLEPRPGEQKSYYEIASELEAQLVLGDLDGARQNARAVRRVIRETAEHDYRGQAGTVRQLQLIIDAKRLDAEWLETMLPPPVIHYLGHIIAAPGDRGRFPAEQEERVQRAVAELLDRSDARVGYGSLAAGADILFAEGLLRRGASLHVVLPFDRADFIESSVRPSGVLWEERFAACLDQAATVRYATEDRHLGDDHLFSYCSQLAMGLALLHASHLSAAAEQFVVWDGNPPSGPVGTAADMQFWRGSGMAQRVIHVGDGFQPLADGAVEPRTIERRTRAMLFGDVKGFSKLRDDQLPAFIDAFLGCFASVIEDRRAEIQFANTWGDGLFLVFDDAGVAADSALTLQEKAALIDRAAYGLPADLALRIGIHLGPVYDAQDPILKRRNFFGAQVSRTARVEPVTPEGCVYLTETMAAVLALHNADRFSCEYVGMTEAAKQYGPMRMFLLRRRAGQ